MIQHSFLLLERVGREKEKGIWKQGVFTWDDFLKAARIKGISARAKKYYDRKIVEARKELFSLNSSYFAEKLPKTEQWRLYDFFKEDAVYLDIETDGVNETDDVTVVGLFDGIDTRTMVRGVNLDFRKLKEELARYKIVVTFNGSVFDVPFIKKRYGAILPRIPHFDLRFCCKRIGLNGGLKGIEKQLGIRRNNELVEKMYGGDAALLHRMWRGSGDEHYLQLLVEYNEEDVINLKRIAERTYRTLKQHTQ